MFGEGRWVGKAVGYEARLQAIGKGNEKLASGMAKGRKEFEMAGCELR